MSQFPKYIPGHKKRVTTLVVVQPRWACGFGHKHKTREAATRCIGQVQFDAGLVERVKQMARKRKITASTPLSALGEILTSRAFNVLRSWSRYQGRFQPSSRRDVVTIGEAVDNPHVGEMTAERLMCWRNCGVRTVNEITTVFAALGFDIPEKE